ncbi:MAG: hypothetical protein R3D31_07645 [Hyphomicrobiaceae bacterium]
MTPDEAQELERARRQRMRSIAIALALVALVVLFYVATIVRLGGNVARRPAVGAVSQPTVVVSSPAPSEKEVQQC